MAEAAAAGKSGKVVIRNVGLMLSGDIDRPILEADTLVVNDGLIVQVGKEADCDTANPDTLPEDMRSVVEQEGRERAACDYISGMTDGYAMEKYGELFIPFAWTVK